MTLGVRKMKLLGVAAVAILAFSASGCSSLPSVPDWVDPTTWFGGDDTPPDANQPPDLASLPDKPGTPAADDQQKVAESLAADRNNAKYSADALRGGTEPAAAPPPDLPVTPKVTAEAEAIQAKKKAAEAAPPAPPPPPKVAAVDRSVAQDPFGGTLGGTLPATQPATVPGSLPATPPSSAVASAPSAVQTSALPAPEAAPAPAAPAAKPAPKKKVAKALPPPAEMAAEPASEPAPVAAPAPAPARTRVAALPPGAQPALAPVASTPAAPVAAPMTAAPAAPVTAAQVSPSDAALGFKPSSAPPLDPSVSQFVAAPIINHYQETAASSGYPYSGRPVAVAKPKKSRKAVAEGGPETMSGAVVANLDALHGGRSSAPAAYAPQSGAASAVVYFPGDIVSLNAEAKAQVRTAVAQYKASGGQGYIRVVGHSSSRTPNMSPEKHVELVFKKSQDRANAVAQEIIREGVPADKVLVEAVGDSQPVYYESMPKGEDGNRRAEIFLQG